MSTNIKDLFEYGTQARIEAEASAAKAAADEMHNMSLDYIVRQIPYWRRYYFRKNQPLNYFRVTRIIPPGMIDFPQAWTHKFQVWTPGKYKELAIEERITSDAYQFLSTQPGWEPESGNPDFFRSKNPNAI